MLEVCEDCSISKIKHESLRKVAEERHLNPGYRIYLDLCSQNKASYGGFNNWILVKDSDTKQKRYFFIKPNNI